MKPLVLAANALRWFCVFPAAESTSRPQKLCYFLFTLVFYITLFGAVVPSAVFFLRFVTVNLPECLYSVFQVSAGISGVFMVIFAMLSKQKIKKFFIALERIYDESKKRFTIY